MLPSLAPFRADAADFGPGGPAICLPGLDRAAKAESLVDVSDNAGAIPYLQQAIITFGDCIDALDSASTRHEQQSLNRADARRQLSIALAAAGRLDDARDQTMRLFEDLSYACDHQSYYKKGYRMNLYLDVTFFQRSAVKYDLPGSDGIVQACGDLLAPSQ